MASVCLGNRDADKKLWRLCVWERGRLGFKMARLCFWVKEIRFDLGCVGRGPMDDESESVSDWSGVFDTLKKAHSGAHTARPLNAFIPAAPISRAGRLNRYGRF